MVEPSKSITSCPFSIEIAIKLKLVYKYIIGADEVFEDGLGGLDEERDRTRIESTDQLRPVAAAEPRELLAFGAHGGHRVAPPAGAVERTVFPVGH